MRPITVYMAILWLLALLGAAVAHTDQRWPQSEIDWMERQYSNGGMQNGGIKCCIPSEFKLLQDDEWRMRGEKYQVRISGSWYDVHPHRMWRHDPEDPSPYGYHAFVFYEVLAYGTVIYCFYPGALT